MTPDRFVALAAAYGGTIARWPETDRADAARLLAAEPRLAGVLAHEDGLDATLDAWRVAGPSTMLRERLDAAAAGRLRQRRLWWSGLGIAAALSGATVGTLATAAVPASSATQAIDDGSATAFGDPTGAAR